MFDWDGTLFDSTRLIVKCIQAACTDLAVPVPSDADAAYVIGLGLHDALKYVVPGLPEERYPELGQRYRHHYFRSQHELTLFPGTLAMLDALKQRHHWLAVATVFFLAEMATFVAMGWLIRQLTATMGAPLARGSCLLAAIGFIRFARRHS